MLHEQQHVLDDTFGIVSGKGWGDHPYRNPDCPPRTCPGPVDNAASGNFLMSVEVAEKDWFDLVPPYVTHKTLPDQDADGLPDSGDVPIAEAQLGTRCADRKTDGDTDADGLSDRDEAIGDFSGGYNPKSADTDGDGLPDAEDFAPRCPSLNYLPRQAVKLDGAIATGEYAKFSTFKHDPGLSGTMYAAWDEGRLHLAAAIHDDQLVTNRKESDNPDDAKNDAVQWLFEVEGDGYVATKPDLGLLNYVVCVHSRGADGNATIRVYEHLEAPGICENRALENHGVVAKYTRRDNGYDIEAIIPKTPSLARRSDQATPCASLSAWPTATARTRPSATPPFPAPRR
jgi:hypothetical protein